MADILIVSGSRPYADSWHRFPETSRRIAKILDDLGHSTHVTEDVEAGLAQPGPCDVLVVNIGNPTTPRPPDRLSAASRGLIQHLDAGRGLLGVHVSATSLTEMPEWPTLLGGRWIRGRTMHPPQSLATVQAPRRAPDRREPQRLRGLRRAVQLLGDQFGHRRAVRARLRGSAAPARLGEAEWRWPSGLRRTGPRRAVVRQRVPRRARIAVGGLATRGLVARSTRR
jgi:hypothetical protein